MALVDVGTGLFVPQMRGQLAAPAFGQLTINAAGERVAFIFRCTQAGTIDRVGFCCDFVTTPQDLRVSFENVDPATGDPDGVVDQFRVVPLAQVIANTYVTTGLMTSDGTDGGVKRTVAVGDLLAIVIDFDVTVGNLGIRVDIEWRADVNFTYTSLFTAAWAPNASGMVGHIEFDDGSFMLNWGMLCADLYTFPFYSSASNPDERALRFTLPFNCRIVGFWCYADIDSDCDVVLYDAASAQQLIQSITQQVQQNPTNGRPFFHYFAGTFVYTADDIMRLSLRPGAVGTSSLFMYDSPTAALMAANEMGDSWHLSTRVDAGAWTDVTDTRPYFGLIVDQLDDGAGGGGGGGGVTIGLGSGSGSGLRHG